MDKRKEQGLAPFSSDECPNSGEDSDEDVITDYLGSASQQLQSDCNVIANGDLNTKDSQVAVTQQQSIPSNQTSKHNAIIMADQSPSPQQQQAPNLLISAANPLVPIISVTPHSPGVARHYPVLEEPLRHLHEIHDKIHQMRDLTLALGNRGDHLQRFSTSCPSLCPLISIDGVIQTGTNTGQHHHHHHHHHHGEQDGSDPDLLTNCSTNSSPTHYHPTPGHAQVSQILQGIDRRRSWTDLEDSRQQRRGSDQNHLQAQNIRQRSISLSSLDSDMDLELDGKTRTRDTSGKPRTSVSQSSTHSLNEADFVQGEFKKVAVKRGGQRLGENVGLMPGVTGSRLPLQKSVSTPSIVIPPPGQNLAETGSRGGPTLSASRHEKGSGSETETDDPHHQHGHEFHEGDLMREGTPSTQASLDELLTDTAYEDRHSEKTKRKRGSLFSRKKKDKSGKKPTAAAQPHTWAPINVSSQGNNTCDFCMKSFASKPALHCENCGAIIHQSQACKDHYQQECKQSKPPSKSSFKSLSSVSISSSSSIVKRGSTVSLPLQASMSGSNNKKPVTSYSPWRRVATKLGVNQTINEERDGGEHKEIPSGQEEFDFDDSQQFSLEEFDREHPELGLGREEPDSWSVATGRRKLFSKNDREVKRQEHIYEFILTEKHHCLVLLAMQRIFVEGLQRHFNFKPSVLDRMFPKLQSLMNIHFDFLRKLRQRQRENEVVDTIADILVEQFSSENSSNMKNAYGEFCSSHRDAGEVYKHHQQADMRFARFVRHCQNNPLLKKKGIPECILFVAQRLTKYPLLVEPLIKTGVDTDEVENLRRALSLVKDILNDVNARVADKERTDRKLDIYHKVDPKSYAWYRGQKFKKSDILASNRNLKFDGQAWLMPNRAGKTGTSNKPGTEVTVVCLTDVLFFLAGDQKYVFFSPDNKGPSIVSLSKLLVREIAGTDKRLENRGIYLISSNPNEPEMFELKLKEPRDKNLWIKAIRAAVEACPQEPDLENNFIENNTSNDVRDSRSLSLSKLSSAEKMKHAREADILHFFEIVNSSIDRNLSFNDELFHYFQELDKMWDAPWEYDNDATRKDKDGKNHFEAVAAMRAALRTTEPWKHVMEHYKLFARLTRMLLSDLAGTTLSRSLSSAGERHSEAYVAPSLAVPKRAETFAGFDHSKERYPSRDAVVMGITVPFVRPKIDEMLVGGAAGETKDENELDLTETRYILEMMVKTENKFQDSVAKQNRVIESMCIQQLAGSKEGSLGKSNNRPTSANQLEELRNLQDQLSRDRADFRDYLTQERSKLDEERAELKKRQEKVAAAEEDIANQREQLYRKMEAFEKMKQQFAASSNAAAAVPPMLTHTPSTAGSDSSHTSRKKSQADEKGMIPQNLYSTTNQQKVQQLPVKQQLPLKLAQLSGSNNNSSRSSFISNNSPDRHSRTGSSPAMVGSSSALSSPELGTGSNGSSSLSHFSMSNRSLRNTRIPEPYPRKHHAQPQPQQQHQQQATSPTQQQRQQQTTSPTQLQRQQQTQQPQQQQSQQKTDEPLEEQVLFL